MIKTKRRPISAAVITALFVSGSALAVSHVGGCATCYAENITLAAADPCAAANPCAAVDPCAAANPCAAVDPCAAANPCAAVDPCAAANPCAAVDPCAAANPCAAVDPCAAANPCAAMAPCGPCGPAPQYTAEDITEPADVNLFSGDRAELERKGEALWNDPTLSTNNMSCQTCHTELAALNETFAEPYPHRVAMPAQMFGMEEVTAAEMVQFCMVQPMAAAPLEWTSEELAALTAYSLALQREFQRRNQ